nr:Gag-Pol polyprotein [Tanacetum cinerariifolium]
MIRGNGGNQFNIQNLGVQDVRNQNGLIVVLSIANQNLNQNGNGNVVATWSEVRPKRRYDAYLQTQLLIAQKDEARIQLQAEEFDLMAAVGDLDEIKEVNENCILMANLVYNRRTKKIIETMNVTFDELLTLVFEQHSSKPRLQGMTSGQITIADTAPTPTNSSSQATDIPNISQDVDEPPQQHHDQQQDDQAQV